MFVFYRTVVCFSHLTRYGKSGHSDKRKFISVLALPNVSTLRSNKYRDKCCFVYEIFVFEKWSRQLDFFYF